MLLNAKVLAFADPPLPIEDFSCISENWENLNCTWKEPYNPIKTTYMLAFKEPGWRTP